MSPSDQLAAAADALHTSADVLQALNLHRLAAEIAAGSVNPHDAQARFSRRQRAHLNLSTPSVISGGMDGYCDAGHAALQHATVTHGAVTGTLRTHFQVSDPTQQETDIVVDGLDDCFTDRQSVRDTIAVMTDLADCWDALTA